MDININSFCGTKHDKGEQLPLRNRTVRVVENYCNVSMEFDWWHKAV